MSKAKLQCAMAFAAGQGMRLVDAICSTAIDQCMAVAVEHFHQPKGGSTFATVALNGKGIVAVRIDGKLIRFTPYLSCDRIALQPGNAVECFSEAEEEAPAPWLRG